MEKDIEGQVRDYRNRKKRYRRRMIFIFFTLFVTVAVVGILYVYRINNKSYKNCKILKTIEVKGDQTTGYLLFGDSIVRYNNDGIEAVDKAGKILWKGSFEMSDPIVDTCGKYIMVADRGNKLIHIYNEKGEDNSINTLYNIVKAKVASQGVVAVMMEDDDKNYIKFYYPDGSVESNGDKDDVLVNMKTNVDTVGYPMDMTLSQDGRKLAVVFLTVNTGKLISTVGFYNFDGVGKNHVDNIVGGYKEKPGIIVPEISFLDNNTVCEYQENGFKLYSMMEKPKFMREISVKDKIASIFHNDKYTGLVLEGSDTAPKRIMVYNLSGKKILDKELDFNYTTIELIDDEIIMHDDTSCFILQVNGKQKFKYKFDQNILGFYPINKMDRYFLAGDSKISEVLLTE